MLNVFTYSRLLEFLEGFLPIMLNNIIDNALFKPQFDGNILAKDNFAFKHILVYKDQFDA